MASVHMPTLTVSELVAACNALIQTTVDPQTDIQKELADVWKDLLGVSKIG